MRVDQAEGRKDIKEAVEQDRRAKERQKHYKDLKCYVKDHNIKPGDAVLLERKSEKSTTPYDPEPYKEKQTHGTQITVSRGEVTRKRDAKQWKKVKVVHNKDYDRIRRELAAKDSEDSDPDIGPPEHQQETEGQQDMGIRVSAQCRDEMRL